MHPHDRFVETRMGRIHYLEAGVGAGPTLILVHSNGASAYEYEFVIEDLAKRYHVIAWDMPGQGDSDYPPRFFSAHDFADAVVALMDALNIKTASVAGSSVGGSIVIALGARHASRMERVFIVEYPIRTEKVWREGWFRTEKMWTNTPQTMEIVGPRLRAGKVTPDFLERWNIDRQKAGPKNALNAMWAMRLHDVEADFAAMNTPVMVIYGSKGPAIPTRALMEKALPNAPIVVCEDCGHFPMVDDPAAFVAAIDKGFKLSR
jgi:pimeloyl-ACP methyl ester carboxylesterase